MKKKLLFVISTLRMGGAEKSLIALLKSLDPDRVDVDLYVFEGGGVLQKEVPEWVTVIEADPLTRGMTLEIRYYLRDVIGSGAIAAAIARISISVASQVKKKRLFSWNIIKRFIPSIEKEYDVAIGYLEDFSDSFVIDKVKAEKKIGWVHTDFSKRSLLAEEKDYFLKFDQLVTISEICREALIRHMPELEKRIHIIENIVLPEEVRKKANGQTDLAWDFSSKKHIVSIGRLEYLKGMDIAAETAKMLRERDISFCWHVYGIGNLHDEISDYIHIHGLQDYFLLEGLRENPYPYMKAADIIVQPSRGEGKSLVLDEAKILGKAIVVTDYPSVSDQIQNRVTGLITDLDPTAIADGIEELFQNSSLKEHLEKNASNECNQSSRALEQFYRLIE